MSEGGPEKSRAPCLIFDGDGVLVESEAVCVRAELGFLSAHGLELWPRRDRAAPAAAP